MRKSKTERLKDEGFDLSYSIPFTSQHRVRCSQCEALVINGTPCHESGCPNFAAVKREKRRRELEEDA